MQHTSDNTHNVINLFTGQPVLPRHRQRIRYICPETTGIRMIYTNNSQPERLISVPLLCWGLRGDGEIVGIVPWLGEAMDCTSIDEHLHVTWEGYYHPHSDELFFEAPDIIRAQLTAIAQVSPLDLDDEPDYVLQEIADHVGTHALIVNEEEQSLLITPIVSWALHSNGELVGLLANETQHSASPVIPGDDCLYPADDHPGFRCFFQRDIVNQIRHENPETLAAIEQLLAT